MASSEVAYSTRRLLRTVLREVAKNPTFSFKHEGSRAWRNVLLGQFRKHKDEQSPEELRHLRQNADTYVCMLKNLREHQVPSHTHAPTPRAYNHYTHTH